MGFFGSFADFFIIFLLGVWLTSFHYLSILCVSFPILHSDIESSVEFTNRRARLAAITPVMSDRDQKILYRYLSGVHTYFEFGAGGATAQAVLRVSKIISVESDARWHAHLREIIGPVGDITWYTIDLKVPWTGKGIPGKDSPPSTWPNYTHAYVSSFNADLIFIDGLFRVSCALCVWSEITTRTFVTMHNFVNHRQYWVVLPWYDLIERGDTLVMLRKKEGVDPPPQTIIAWYDKQPEDRLMPEIAVPELPQLSKSSAK
jgi:hypothetical protein